MVGDMTPEGQRRSAFTREQWIDHLQRLADDERRAHAVPLPQDNPLKLDYLLEVRRVVRQSLSDQSAMLPQVISDRASRS